MSHHSTIFGPHGQIHIGDAHTTLLGIPDKSINCCVTSPPYWNLRNYNVAGQIGLEASPKSYIERLIAVFGEVWRVLKDDGTLWLNLGDTYIGYHGNKNNPDRAPSDKNGYKENMRASSVGIEGLKSKDLVGIPWRVAFALQDAGWYLRTDIIWHKPNPMPESVKDRPTRAHEYLFLFSKKPRYYYDADAIREPSVYMQNDKSQSVSALNFANLTNEPSQSGNSYPNHRIDRTTKVMVKRSVRPNIDTRGGGQGNGQISFCPYVRNRRSVWSIPTKPYAEAHFATFPPDLIRPCILAGCPENGIVLDPFFGSGTTGQVCVEENRKYLGIELNPEYAQMAMRRIAITYPKDSGQASLLEMC